MFRPPSRLVEVLSKEPESASRVMDKAGAGEVLLTRTLKDLTGGSDMRFESAGDYELKGLSEPYQLFRPLGLEVAAA